MRSKIVFALFALVALGIAAGRSAIPPAPVASPAQVNPLVQAIAEEHGQLAAQCIADHEGALIRAYPDPRYPDSFQMTTIQCQHGFLVSRWDRATLTPDHHR